MKNLLLMFTLLITLNASLLLSSNLNCAILDDLARGMHHILLPDGKTIFGETSAVIGNKYFDLNDLDHDSRAGFTKLSTFTGMLELANTAQNPSWIFWSSPSLPELKEFLKVYVSIIEDASHLNPSALMLIETILRTGQVNSARTCCSFSRAL